MPKFGNFSLPMIPAVILLKVAKFSEKMNPEAARMKYCWRAEKRTLFSRFSL